MAYKINFKQSVSKDLKRIDKSITSEILDKIDAELSINADKYPVLNGKFAGLRKFRTGDYRIIFHIRRLINGVYGALHPENKGFY